MKRSIVLCLVLFGCDAKPDAGAGSPAADKADADAKPAAPTSGHCFMDVTQKCFEYSEAALKSKGVPNMEAMCDPPVVENKPCPTENLAGTCSGGAEEMAVKFYTGWTPEMVAAECTATSMTFQP